MAAFLAIFMFAFFITLDWAIQRASARRAVAAESESPVRAPALSMQPVADPVFVAGYELPAEYHYHRGHTWARVLGPDTVAIGVDDFARRLIGKAKGLKLPKVGTWVRQGGKSLRIDSERHSAELLSPVEGTVVAVNPDVKRRPSLCSEDPYGHGWLFKVRSANLAANVRNLLSGRLARKWIEDAREQLELRLMALSGSVLQDGGEPSADFADHVDDDEWQHLAEAFFLSEGDEG